MENETEKTVKKEDTTFIITVCAFFASIIIPFAGIALSGVGSYFSFKNKDNLKLVTNSMLLLLNVLTIASAVMAQMETLGL